VEKKEFPLPRNFDCLKSLVAHYEKECGELEEYEMKYIKYFVRECERNEQNIEELKNKIRSAC